MQRKIVLPVVAVLGLAALLAWKVRAEEAALHGPAGGSGLVEGTEIRLIPRLSARVLKRHVEEGTAVQAGTLLVELDCAEPDALVAEAEARLEAARAQAEAARAAAGAAGENAAAARAQAEATRAQARALEARRDAARRQAERLSEVTKDVSASTLDQVQSEAEGLDEQATAATGSGQALGRQARAARDQQSAARAQADAADRSVEAAGQALARARLSQAECRVVAPRAGIVELLPYEVGELLPPGGEAARLVDLSTVTATFFLPNAELGAARPGAAARVEADAYLDEVFEGTVQKVASEAEFTPRNIQTRTDRDRLVYQVEVAVPNPEGKLRAGMPVMVTLPGTER